MGGAKALFFFVCSRNARGKRGGGYNLRYISDRASLAFSVVYAYNSTVKYLREVTVHDVSLLSCLSTFLLALFAPL